MPDAGVSVPAPSHAAVTRSAAGAGGSSRGPPRSRPTTPPSASEGIRSTSQIAPLEGGSGLDTVVAGATGAAGAASSGAVGSNQPGVRRSPSSCWAHRLVPDPAGWTAASNGRPPSSVVSSDGACRPSAPGSPSSASGDGGLSSAMAVAIGSHDGQPYPRL